MPDRTIQVGDKQFKLFISSFEISQAVEKIAGQINQDFRGEEVVFLCILNGSFMFAADLVRHITLPDSQISFVKLCSYEGTCSSGKARELIGIDEDLKDRTVIIVEDIIDTGFTLETITEQLKSFGCKKVITASLLFKPGAYKSLLKIDYVGIEIPNAFVIGYGLDYNGLGRQLKELYHEYQ